MSGWETRCVVLGGVVRLDRDDEVEALGADGWELVTVVHSQEDAGCWVALFKRPRGAAPEAATAAGATASPYVVTPAPPEKHKHAHCVHCKAVVAYLPKDVKSRAVQSYGDDNPSRVYEVKCPGCKRKTEVRGG